MLIKIKGNLINYKLASLINNYLEFCQSIKMPIHTSVCLVIHYYI